jgi:hypothetical protein
MADKDNMLNIHRVKEPEDILDQRRRIISRGGLVRLTMASARQAQDVEMIGKYWGYFIESMGRICQAVQEEQSFAATAPVQIMQTYAIDADIPVPWERFVDPLIRGKRIWGHSKS